jgi:catechol 2,3-dioxygenase-like lactoylglutathione lyase family enzyme
MNLDSIDHVTVNVSNIEAAVAWYSSSFECEVLKQEPTFAVLQFANIKLQLALPSIERFHLGYSKRDASAFGEVKAMKDGSRGTYIADPAGNIVELVET